jgi:hypothetical protein
MVVRAAGLEANSPAPKPPRLALNARQSMILLDDQERLFSPKGAAATT